MSCIKRPRRLDCPLLACLAALLLAGCGGDSGPERYSITGKVTFQGQPVPAGRITFTPDASQGNEGPGAIAEIRNGTYATEPGKGVTGGPTVVMIAGYDGQAVPENDIGVSIFQPYTTTVDLPAPSEAGGKFEQDFVVPEE